MGDQPRRTKFQSSSQEQSRTAGEGEKFWDLDLFSPLSQCIQTFILFLIPISSSHLHPYGCCLKLISSNTSTLSILMHWTLPVQYTYLKLQNDWRHTKRSSAWMYSQVDECMLPLLSFRAKNSVVFRRTWAQRPRTHRRIRWPIDHQLLTYPGLGLAWSSWSLQGSHEYTQVKCANCHESWNSLDAQREGMGLKPATVSRCQRLGISPSLYQNPCWLLDVLTFETKSPCVVSLAWVHYVHSLTWTSPRSTSPWLLSSGIKGVHQNMQLPSWTLNEAPGGKWHFLVAVSWERVSHGPGWDNLNM